MVQGLQEFDLYWMEEPVLNDDLDGYLRLRGEFPAMTWAWGENGFSREIYQSFLDQWAVDVVMLDPFRYVKL
jgi:L-alanine-DL-glutamate epimerase-like enolase superfamily enzyme